MSETWSIEQYRKFLKGDLGEGKTSPKKPKYGNKKVIVDCLKFDSIKEGNRYKTLKLLQEQKQVFILGMQIPFKLPGDITYIADFVYIDYTANKLVVEDVKSEATRKNRVYINKKKQLKALYGIEIHEF